MIFLLSILASVPTEPIAAASAVDFTWLFIKMLLVLAIVSVLAVLILKYAVPHFGFLKPLQKGQYFKVIGRYVLEPKKSLFLVNVGKRYLVIGVADSGISLVTEIGEDDVKGNSS